MDDYFFPSISKITSTIQGIKHGELTLQEEELWRIIEKAFYAYDQRKLLNVFIRNEQLAFAIYDEKGGNEHTKISRAMHFNVRKCCMPIYDNQDDWKGETDQDENGNVHLRKAIGMQMIGVLENDLIQDHKWGQTLKYSKPNINKLKIRAHLTDDDLSLIPNDEGEIARELSVDNEFDYNKFECFYAAWEEENDESIDE
jgi:hypothetical protein